MFNRSDSKSSSPSFSPSFNPKKRRRQPSECELPANISTDRTKPRRIDPDRLAVRLGPEMVAEMDAFIVPGAKMPSFQVRQELVTKYNVDRRHIYDYFHSRGLRVAKEDKHLNLSRRMAPKAAVARKPTAPLSAPTPEDVDSSDKCADAAIREPSAPTIKPAPRRTVPAKMKSSSTRRTKTSSRPAPTLQRSVSPLLPSLDISSMDVSSDIVPSEAIWADAVPSDAFLPDSISSDDSSSEGGNSPILSAFDSMDVLTDSTSFDSFYELELLSLGYSVKLSESYGLDSPLDSSFDLPEDPLFTIDDLLQPDVAQDTSVSAPDPILPLDFGHLSQNERMEFYNLVNTCIGPAQGIQESAGTYKAHMERLYFNRSYPAAQPRSLYDDAYDSPAAQAQAALTARAQGASTARVQAASVVRRIEKENVDPAFHTTASSNPYNPQTTVSSSPMPRRNSYHVSSPRREPLVKSTLVPNVAANHTATPPVPLSDPLPHARPIPLVWTSPIKCAISSSQLRTQQWQVQMATVPFALPQFYTPSGDRVLYNIPPRA
ncbi:hypothetical protein C8R43DRAFT_1137839 [Mycena crocata]|nr:hypothetical protein C8R43DRAFT_1137839 [Mycena crocata]